MKKGINIGFFVGLSAYLIVALGFSSSKEKEVLCVSLQIHMVDSSKSHFFSITELERLIMGKDITILGYPVGQINLPLLEENLLTSPYIESAELYFNLGGILHADIKQRIPVVRVITGTGESWYLDEKGYLFPHRKSFTPHILVASGYFTGGEKLKNIQNIEELAEEEAYSEWVEILDMAKFISEDPFWQSQVVQVYYNRLEEFELIPRVGAHQIMFGNGERLEAKFKKLRTLYREGLEFKGWNQYDRINLKYENQVICTKR